MMRNEPLQQVMVEEPFRLSKDEQEFIRSCLGTQFLRNDLPWSFGTGILVRMAMKAGYLKYSRATVISTVLGTFVFSRAMSYGQCFQSLVQQPGSTVGERMNQRRRMVMNQSQNQPDRGLGILQPAEVDPTYAQPNYLDVDINKPDYPGIDPSTPYPEAGEATAQSRPGQTYADLRRQNRESYVQQFRTRPPTQAPAPAPAPAPDQAHAPSQSLSQGAPSQSLSQGGTPSSTYQSTSYSFDSAIGSYDRPSSSERLRSSSAPEKPEESPARRRVRTNKYGDIIEE